MMASTSERRCILLADDSPTYLSQVKGLLATTGYEILDCLGAVQAQEVMAREHYRVDLLIIDLKMPGMDGFEYLGWLRRQAWGGEMKVLALTGAYELDEIVQPLRELGVLGLMDKGSHPHHILTRVNAVLNPEVVQMRKHQRVTCNLPVSYSYGSLAREALLSHLSLGGCFLVTEEVIPVESTIEVNLHLPTTHHLHRIAGRVVWLMGGEGWNKARSAIKGIGVQWKNPGEDATRDLREFVDRRQEEEKIYDLIAP
jgi:response regulator RpfG family c-di-GMP phosphodiesterase